MKPSGYANSRAHRLVYESDGTADFTDEDWLDCALACIDQAGFAPREQASIEQNVRALYERRRVKSVKFGAA